MGNLNNWNDLKSDQNHGFHPYNLVIPFILKIYFFKFLNF